MERTHIEQCIDSELLELIKAGNPILVSGKPLRIYHPTNKSEDKFLDDCPLMTDELLLPPYSLFAQVIPVPQRSYISPEYNTDAPADEEAIYPAICGFLVDGSKVVMGIREALGFDAKPYEG